MLFFFSQIFTLAITLLASINEPPLPRRKKCPELAYRTNEFLAARGKNEAIGHDRTDAGATTHTRARVSVHTQIRTDEASSPFPFPCLLGRSIALSGWANVYIRVFAIFSLSLYVICCFGFHIFVVLIFNSKLFTTNALAKRCFRLNYDYGMWLFRCVQLFCMKRIHTIWWVPVWCVTSLKHDLALSSA